MRDLFRGWRRKAGCVTLVMACVFAAGWVRSYYYMDVINVKSQYVSSDCSMLIWLKAENWAQFRMFMRPSFWQTQNASEQRWANFLSDETDELAFSGFHFGKGVSKNGLFNFSYWAVPYWSIVLPLTLLSIYLLLSKQPPVKVKVQP